MQTGFPLNTYRADLANIVESVFQTMMDIEVQPVEALCSTPQVPPAANPVTGAVYFAGEWRGAVLIECTRQQACYLAHRFMGVDTPLVIDDDVRDTIGELANMLAGNLKSVLPGGVGLSMPSVVEGTDYSLRICGGNAVERVLLTGVIGSFCITLIEMLDRNSH
ncbi:MAG: chemotaxis protein CheX [Bryobacteraceae bacterium]|jgi:chemotaxis protein CheX